MNTDRSDDKELLDLLGEPAHDGEVDEGGDAPAAERSEYATLLNELRVRDDAAPSAGFNGSLRAAWAAEMGARPPVNPQKRHHWWRLSIPLAAAAVIAFVLLWPGGLVNDRNGGGGVAWADVVKAMDRVTHFHMIAFSDDPRRADERMKMFRIDLFYQQPDRWRAQGMSHVAFSIDGKRQTWSVEKRKFTEKGERAPDMFPDEFVEQHQRSGTLPAILASVFDGRVPQGEPVRSDEVSASQGIDVFDYAQKATEKWARIWVLRESKLPLKMHLYYPGSDEFTLVTFDYSDPQPASFFDPGGFAKQAEKLDADDVYRAYSIGSTPVAGTRPRGADQIHAIEGGYRAPKVKRVLSNDAGDVLLVTDNPRNMTPTGHWPLEQRYRAVTDNWGNTFIPFGRTWGPGEQADRRTYFMPLPPVKLTGEGPRTITLSFVVVAGGQTGTEETLLATETLPVPDPSVKGEAKDWKIDLAAEKRSAYRSHIQQNGTLAQQLEEIDRVLGTEPAHLATLAWKFSLLREHGREGPAWALFEREMRDRIFGDPKLLNAYYVPAAEYLLYLAGQGRDEELARLSAVARKVMETARESKGTRSASQLYNLERVEANALYPAAHVLEWREAYKEGPQVVRTLTGRDGLVFVELAIPKPPLGWESNGWDGQAPNGWFWQPRLSAPWEIQARLVKLPEQRLWLVLRGQGKQVQLSSDATLALDNYGSKPTRHDAVIKWQRTLDIPTPTIDDMKAWWTKENGGKPDGWWPDRAPPATQPVAENPNDWGNQAAKLRDAGQYAEALALYERALAAPKEQWPSFFTDGMNPGLLESTKRLFQVSRAQCLAELGRLDEARKVATDMRAALPEPPDLRNRAQSNTAADAVAAGLHVARVLLKRGEVDAAAAELDRIGQRRPSLTDVASGTVMEPMPWGKSGWSPRAVQEEAWRKYDALWWEVKDALQPGAATPPTTSAAAG